MPRLIEGEIAQGIAAKQARRKEIVKNIINALEESLANPSQAGVKTLHAFGSYRKLASWTDSDLDIASMAENTLRKYLEEIYPGGISAFDQARQKLLKISKETVSTPGTKAAYKQSHEALKNENQILTNRILQFSAQYLDLLEKTSSMAKAHSFLQDFLKAHHGAYPNAHQGLRVIPGAKDDD